jgi:hypothetical protein
MVVEESKHSKNYLIFVIYYKYDYNICDYY